MFDILSKYDMVVRLLINDRILFFRLISFPPGDCSFARTNGEIETLHSDWMG